jgi:hypothetical protein
MYYHSALPSCFKLSVFQTKFFPLRFLNYHAHCIETCSCSYKPALANARTPASVTFVENSVTSG